MDVVMRTDNPVPAVVLRCCLQYVDAATAEQQEAQGIAGPGDDTLLSKAGRAEVRQQLKLADAARRQAEEELEFEEVPQPDEDADGL